MEYKDNEWHISQDGDNMENALVPSSLLPTILYRLGLTPEQALSELSVDDLRTKLKSSDWEVRVAAVRALGKLDTDAHLELLMSALDDEDESVRSAAVHVLGKVGKRVSLDRLMAALYDSDWHVRETAVLALGKLAQHVPGEVFMTALSDTDGSVREAAMLALQWNSPEESTSVSYGKLLEKKTMQNNGYNATPSSGNGGHSPFETAPYDDWRGSSEDGRNPEVSGSMQQQMQEYAPQEYAFYERDDAFPSREEKVTPRRRRSQKGWWAVIAIAALGFFLLGGGMTMWLMPHSMQVVSGPSMAIPGMDFPFVNFKYNVIAQSDIANALRLTPQQITMQLQQGKNMTDIAAAQGVSANELQNIELKAFADLFNTAVKFGDIDQQTANHWINELQNNPPLLDKVTVELFLGAPGPGPGSNR